LGSKIVVFGQQELFIMDSQIIFWAARFLKVTLKFFLET
jgi:hypothetical protein